MKIPINKILKELGIDELDLKNEKEVEEFKKELQFMIEESERDYDEKDSLGMTGDDWANALKEGIKDKE